MATDTYQTIAAPAEGFYKEKGSKFIAYVYEVDSEETVRTCLEEVQKLHNKARHYCYAYRIGKDGNRFRANDDGEPSGTAGRPILGQIDSFGLTNLLAVVVRYFGGTKLGTSGLKRSYKTATQDALEQATIIERIVVSSYQVVFDYVATSAVMNFIKQEGFAIKSMDYQEKTTLLVQVRQSEAQRFETTLNKIIGVKVEEVR
ncbi:MAG: YigZ family protein [Aureispira sp.]